MTFTTTGTRLAALGDELSVRLPRLITLVRLLREQPLNATFALAPAIKLARQLLELQDEAAETDLLPAVDICKNMQAEMAHIHKFSFKFRKMPDVHSALL